MLAKHVVGSLLLLRGFCERASLGLPAPQIGRGPLEGLHVAMLLNLFLEPVAAGAPGGWAGSTLVLARRTDGRVARKHALRQAHWLAGKAGGRANESTKGSGVRVRDKQAVVCQRHPCPASPCGVLRTPALQALLCDRQLFRWSRMACMGSACHTPADTYEHVASILPNVTRFPAGRRLLLQPGRGLLQALASQVLANIHCIQLRTPPCTCTAISQPASWPALPGSVQALLGLSQNGNSCSMA